MLSTTHALASALIVTKIPSPIISLPLIIICHYLMDAVPHWDTGTGLKSGKKSKKTAFFQTLIDLAIAATTVFFLFQIGKAFSVKLWFGVLVGISPDLAEAPVNFLNYHHFLIKKLEKIHQFFHRSWKFPYGLIPQIIIIIAILLIASFT